ncbi:hypothetical protein [Nevskia sp.]|uniref:DUF7933 domain-containing protein n=1 Tax=Nevskia sp. TaxID=1929292 RepID=UPI0025F469EA|nr:hypothetical protein [Nevskia sp.]
MNCNPATDSAQRPSRSSRVLRRLSACLLALSFGGWAVPALAVLDVNKSFTPINIRPGETSVLTVDLFNNESAVIGNTQFVDNLPVGVTVVGSIAPVSTCGGVVTVTGGGTGLTLTGGDVPAQVGGVSGQCSVSVTVTGSLSGTYINTIPAGGATGDSGPNGGLGPQANPQPASATLTISAFIGLTGVKDFPNGDPDFVKGGGTAPFSITLDNANDLAVTGLQFTDTFPPLIAISGAAFTNTCGGTISDPGNGALGDGDSGIRLTGGSIPANSSCTITATVRPTNSNAVVDTTVTNTIPAGAVTTLEGAINGAPLAASIAVESGGAIVKSFNQPSVLSDNAQASTLTLSLRNFNATAIVGAALTDNLPAGVSVAAVPNIGTVNCGAAAVAAAPGGGSIVITGATIPAAANALDAFGECVVTVDVVTSVEDDATNTIPDGSFGAGLPAYSGASAVLFGNNFAIAASKAFAPDTVAQGDVTTLTITLSNISALPATIASFTDDLTTAGAGITIAAAPAASTTCVGGTVVAPVGGTLITQTSGVIPAGGSCSITVPVLVSAAAGFGSRTNVIQVDGVVTDRGTNNGAAFGTLFIGSDIGGSKAFVPTTVPRGTVTTLTITLLNTTAIPAAISSFTDDLNTLDPGTFVVAAAPPASTTCGGTVNAPVGGTLITKTDGVIPANGSCTITVPVLPLAGAPLALVDNEIAIGAIQTDQGSNPVTVVNFVTVTNPISGAKAFTPSSIVRGQDTLLTITLNNSSATAATALTLTDDLTSLDAGGNFSIAATPAAVSTCGGTLTAAPGSTSLSLTGGTIPATGSCTITVPVTASLLAPVGLATNTIPAGGVSASLGANGAPITADLTLNPAAVITKSFTPPSIGAGQVSRLSVTISHAAGAPAFTGVALADDLTTLGGGHVVDTVPNITNTCGGSVVAVAGSTSVNLTGGALASGATSCSFAVNVRTPATLGIGTNTIPAGALVTDQGISNDAPATATLNRVAIVSTLILNKSFTPTSITGATPSVLAILIDNSQPSSIPLDGVALLDTFPTGMIVAPTPSPTFTGVGCALGTITAVPGEGSVALNGATVAAGSVCTLNVNVTSFIDGNLTNTIPVNAVSSAQGVSNANAPQATLTVQRNISVVKAFVPATVTVGDVSILRLQFVNNEPVTRTNGQLIDNFPTGLVAAGPATENTCGVGSTVTNGAGAPLVAGATSIRVNGATFLPNSTCQVSVPVTAAVAGTYLNSIPSNALTTTEGSTNADPAEDTLTNLVAPTIAKSFTPASIAVGGSSTISFLLTNANNGTLLPGGYTGASFTDALTGMSIAADGAAGGSCVGAAGNVFTAGQTALSFTGLAIPVSGSCTVTVVVTALAAGVYPNVTSGVVTTQTPANPGPPSNIANLTVVGAGVPLSGYVYYDANTNGTLDGAEDWNAGAPVFVNAVQGGVVVYSQAVPVGGGFYQFPAVVPGNYTLVVADSPVSITPLAPVGFRFVSPTDGSQLATVGTTPALLYNFGLIDGGLVSGRVFRDSGPTANDGIQQSPADEPGLPGVTVRLTNCAATTYATTTTNGNGDYFLPVPSTVVDGSAVCVEEINLPGYLSTGANVAGTATVDGTATSVGGTSYVYTRLTPVERSQFTYSAAQRLYGNINFGDVPPNAFTTDNIQTALPGTAVFHPHTYTAQTGGSVVFTTAAVASPQIPGWTEVIYLDANCNAAIDAGELPITGPLTLVAGQQVCIVDREFVPAAAPDGARNVVTVTATFTYTNALPGLNNVQTRTDTTTVGDATGAALVLSKTVSSGTASPGTVLTYTITYTNRSTEPLNTIVVNDATPSFTSFVSAAAGPLPASLTACQKTTPAGGPVDCAAVQAPGGRGALRWTFTGSLQPGGSGTVSFQVQVDP